MTKIEKIIKYFLIFIGILFLMFIWNIIPIIILKICKIDIDNMNKTLKILVSFASDILFLLLLMFIYSKTVKKDFKNYFNTNFKKNIKESFLTWLIGFSIMIASNLIIAILTDGTITQNEQEVRKMIDLYPLYMAFQLTIYAPITEELIFRKSIKDITNNKYIYIFLSGFIFGGLHVLTSIKTTIDLLYLIPYCALGFAFAYLYHKTDNIFSTITAHTFHNLLALLIYLKGIH